MARDDDFDNEHSPSGGATSGRSGPSLFLILLIAIAAIAAVFVVQNRDEAEIQFLFFSGFFRIWTAIAFAILLGVLLDRAIIMWWRRARKRND